MRGVSGKNMKARGVGMVSSIPSYAGVEFVFPSTIGLISDSYLCANLSNRNESVILNRQHKLRWGYQDRTDG
jgi:hypothetical protein